MDATPAKPIESYDELVQVLRNRLCDLRITLDTLDSIAGLAPRYASKLLSASPVKHLGAVSLFPVLTTLGLRMRLESDDELLAKLRQRSDWVETVRTGPRYRPSHSRKSRRSPTAHGTTNES